MKRIILFYGLSILSTCLFAQYNRPYISFDKEIHDFGKIQEEKGNVSHKFVFTNTGAAPLIIQNVKTSCGCASPVWIREPVKPGEKGFVNVTFDPKNRPGIFTKNINVTTNAEKALTRLKITGEVIPRVKTVEELYPGNMSGVRFKTNNISLGKVMKGEICTKEVEIINTLDNDATITFRNVPGYIVLEVIPATLKPDEKGIIRVSYNSEKSTSWGHGYARINVGINNTYAPKDRLGISANITEDFSKLTPEERENAAHISFSQTSFNFGAVKQGELVEHLFEFKNTGKSDLIIRQVRASCGCTAVKPEKSVIKPGESSTVKAIFNTRGRKGNQSKSIIVITNDPDKPTQVLNIKGKIELP